MGLKSEASQPLITRKLIDVIILGPRKINKSQDKRSTTVVTKLTNLVPL